jgi:hypothetical protein
VSTTQVGHRGAFITNITDDDRVLNVFARRPGLRDWIDELTPRSQKHARLHGCKRIRSRARTATDACYPPTVEGKRTPTWSSSRLSV